MNFCNIFVGKAKQGCFLIDTILFTDHIDYNNTITRYEDRSLNVEAKQNYFIVLYKNRSAICF